eukprot:s3773_g9.t1
MIYVCFFPSDSHLFNQQSPRKTGGLCRQTCLPPENAPAFARRCVFDAIHGKGKWQFVRKKHRSENGVGNLDNVPSWKQRLKRTFLNRHSRSLATTSGDKQIRDWYYLINYEHSENTSKICEIRGRDNFRNQKCQ